MLADCLRLCHRPPRLCILLFLSQTEIPAPTFCCALETFWPKVTIAYCLCPCTTTTSSPPVRTPWLQGTTCIMIAFFAVPVNLEGQPRTHYSDVHAVGFSVRIRGKKGREMSFGPTNRAGAFVLQEGKEAENAVSIALGSSDPQGHATPLLHFSASLHYADMVGVRSPLDAFVRAFGATALRTFDQAVGNGFQNLKALRSRLPGNVSTTMSLADLGTPKVPYTPFFSSLSLLLHPPRPPDLTPASHVGSALIPGSRAHHSAHVHVRNARSFAARRRLSFQ